MLISHENVKGNDHVAQNLIKCFSISWAKQGNIFPVGTEQAVRDKGWRLVVDSQWLLDGIRGSARQRVTRRSSC